MKKSVLFGVCLCMLVGCAPVKESEQTQTSSEEEVKSQYTILDTELPNFDYTPINFENKGYIVSVDGKFGMMDALGNWLKKTEYGSLFAELMTRKQVTYCAVPTGDGVLSGGFALNSVFDDVNTNCGNSGYGGTSLYRVYVTGENGNYATQYNNFGENVENADLDWNRVSPNGNALKFPYKDSNGNIDYNQYFVGTASGEIFGPFDKEYAASINLQTTDSHDTFQYLFNFDSTIYGHFVIPEKEGYRIYNNQGNKSFDQIVDSYQFITDEQIQYTIGKKVGILDKDLNVLIETDEFEDVSAPMNGLFFAKKDGKWHVVRDTDVSDDELYVTPDYVENRGNSYTANYEMSIRDAPSKSANKLDRIIKEGETVRVYELKSNGNTEQWGRIDENQWVCIYDSDASYLTFNMMKG